MKAAPAVWTGRVLTALSVVVIAVDLTIKLLNLPMVVEWMQRLGWGASYAPLIGGVELIGLALYLIPRTSLLGAALMTGVLGGAIVAHIRAGDPLFGHILFSVWLMLFMWGGLWLRASEIQAMVPVRGSAA